MKRASIIGLILVTSLYAAETSGPRSPMAVKARRVYEQQLNWTNGEFEQALKAAREKRDAAEKSHRAEYVATLKRALDVALQAKDLEESNRISAAIKGAEQPIAASDAAPPAGTWLCRMAKSDGEEYTWEMATKGMMLVDLAWIDKHGNRNAHSPARQHELVPQADGSFRMNQGGWGHTLLTFAGGKVFVERYEKRNGGFESGVGSAPLKSADRVGRE